MPEAWLFQTGEPWPLEQGQRLLRSGLVARALVHRGWTVRWWLSAFEHQRKRWMVDKETEELIVGGTTYSVLRGSGYKRNFSLRRYVDHRIVARRFLHRANVVSQPDLVVASLPCHRLAQAAMRFARSRSIPTVLDVRDTWPDTFVEKATNDSTLRMAARMVLHREDAATKEACRSADSIVAVSQGFLKWALKKAERGKRDTDVVLPLAYPRLANENMQLPAVVSARLEPATQLATFVGTFGRSYQIEVVLRAAAQIYARGNRRILFVLAGTGEQYEEVYATAKGLPNVVLTGWIDGGAIAALLRRSQVGLLPCVSTPDTVPNKAFEYLSAGLPLASSLEGELAQLIDVNQIGFNYSSGDFQALARGIESILGNDTALRCQAANARRLFAALGDADAVYSRYVDHLERIVSIHSTENLQNE